ncbi:acyltransferase family protein [Undibacterium parvum]|uniref:Acyltransferase n=1 Tax=Undibacterium parvum TaxID=401471 RepID=A0A3Q9BQ14_9BURK|nr:acyltransferase [Undibacterium parvum]AZP11887.1 acyltransferase [Undibacterium parvum]
MQKSSLVGRLHGLDTLRSCAILLVLMYHYKVVVSRADTFGIFSQIGWSGVDLFFVLSGYLIGNQIFASLRRQDFSLKNFYIRRFLRTLPSFYVVLAFYFLLPGVMGGSSPPSLWRFLSFTQNLGLHTGTAFSHAWSLCIEEQFYLILPALALLFVAGSRYLKKSMIYAWLLLLGLICGAIALRAYLWQNYVQDAESFYGYIYYSSLARFDELLPGVALALIKNYHRPVWSRLQQWGNQFLLLGLGCVALMFYLFANYHYVEPQGYTYAMTTWGYSLMAISFSLLVLAALSPSCLLHKFKIPGCSYLALWSYAIYLVHKAVFFILSAPIKQAGIGLESALGLSLMLLCSLIAGYLLYALVETPFMRLRERYFSSAAAPPATPLAAPNPKRTTTSLT